MAGLRLENVRRSFRIPGRSDTEILRGVSLAIEQGDFVSIVGPSGGGKSTLLNIIGLLDEPTSGTYFVDGLAVATANEKALSRLRSDRFAFVFQSFHLLERRPVLGSVELGLFYRGLRPSIRRARAFEALRRVGLESLARQRPDRLSGGERQRVAIARALASGAPVVVADEPTGNLDSESSGAVVESLLALHRLGVTIILVTHSAEVAAVAGRRLRIRDGLVEPDGVPAALEEPPTPLPAVQPVPGEPSKVRLAGFLADAFASLRSRPARTTGLAAAVAVGVGLAIATLGLSASGSAQVSDTFDVHVNRDVSVEWTPAELSALSAEELSSIPERLGALRGVQYAGVLSEFDGHLFQLTPARTTLRVPVYAATDQLLEAARSDVIWAPGHSHRLGRGEAVLGANLAGQTSLGPLAGGPVVAVDGHDVTIVGVVEASPRVPDLLGAVVVPSADTGLLGDASDVKALILTSAGAAQQVARQAPLVIDPYEPGRLAVSAPVDPTTLRSAIESDVGSTLFAFTGVALLAALATLANAMVVSIMERRQEFGLRRALGARPRHIAGLVVVESSIVGVAGGVLGLAGGLIAVLAITISRHWAPVLDLGMGPIAVAGGMAVGVLGGLVASIRASRIQPNEALR